MKKLLIVEKDETLREVIKKIVLQHFSEFTHIETVTKISDARTSILRESPSLILLDINLSDGTAFDLLKQVEIVDFKILFMSDSPDITSEAIQFSSIPVIIKPFDLADMVSAIDKACEAIHESDYEKKIEILLSNATQPTTDKIVVFPTIEANQATRLSSILFGEAVAGGCIIHTDNNKDYFVPRPLRHYEQLFSNYGFIRCHPLFVVNLHRIRRIEKTSSLIQLDNHTEIPIEPRKYETINAKFHETGF